MTGGLGTIPVTHAGKTYHVCCTGCVAAFEADPEGTLADYPRPPAVRRRRGGSPGMTRPGETSRTGVPRPTAADLYESRVARPDTDTHAHPRPERP